MINLSMVGREIQNRGTEHLLSGVYRERDKGVTGMAVENDVVNHPAHYTDGGIETLDYILAKRFDFLLGQVCKYISRAGKKDKAKELEDLQKARFYLDRKIKLLEVVNHGV